MRVDPSLVSHAIGGMFCPASEPMSSSHLHPLHTHTHTHTSSNIRLVEATLNLLTLIFKRVQHFQSRELFEELFTFLCMLLDDKMATQAGTCRKPSVQFPCLHSHAFILTFQHIFHVSVQGIPIVLKTSSFWQPRHSMLCY